MSIYSYNPSIEPDKETWLETSETDRLDAVLDFHQNNGDDLDEEALMLHSSIHEIVENQIAMGVDLLSETMARLRRQGLSRHEAIHAIGAVISSDIWEMVHDHKEFSPKLYRRKLEKLTAKRWRKSQY